MNHIFLFFLLLNTEETKAEISRTINLKELGIENTEDAATIVVKAPPKCKEAGISKFEFPQGTYHFYPTFAPDRCCAITNNDNEPKHTLV